MIDEQQSSMPVTLTIAGLDPSGGAGVIADIKTFTAYGCFAAAAVTSLTFQNTTGVFGAAHQSARDVRAQILPLVQDYSIAAVKTGMLPTREVISEVARLLRETALPAPVVDPVVRSTSGYDLIDDAALAALMEKLLPLARVVTPNIPEAERMTGLRVHNEEGMRRAARRLREMGARAVLIKGGHLPPDRSAVDSEPERSAVDSEREGDADSSVLDLLDEDGSVTLFRGERVWTNSTHGTGCTLAAAMAACLARGLSLRDAIASAKRFVTEALRQAPGLGRGHGPINHNVRASR